MDYRLKCPYCGNAIETNDQHAYLIERKNVKEKTTVVVSCKLVNTVEIQVISREEDN